MKYQIGDQVVHWMYGLGKVIGLDEKRLGGQTHLYYVMSVGELTIWVPVEEQGESCLRPPTPSSEFKSLFGMLSKPGEPLLDRQTERKMELAKRLKNWTMLDICQIICDLNTRSSLHKLNLNDITVFKRAREFLLAEWVLSLGTSRENAERELDFLLSKNQSAPATP